MGDIGSTPLPPAQRDRLDYGRLDYDRLDYERYRPLLFGYILRLVGSPADAEDILHESFIRALAFLGEDGPRDEDHYRRWLYTVATNLCRDDARRRARSLRRAVSLDAHASTPSGDFSGAGEPLWAIDPAASFPTRLARHQLIEEVFARMEPADVSALLLCDHFGFLLREVAQALDCSYAAAAKRVARARHRFAHHYRELGGEEVAR
ncbi:MAG TPA: RNA polymerase sigma factor [Ktedonobacterales bacterium]